MKDLQLNQYIQNRVKLSFCIMELYEFGKSDESISICKSKLHSHRNLEEFVIQSFLVCMGEDLYMKEEELLINHGKLEKLEDFLFKNNWNKSYTLNSIEIDLTQWISSEMIEKIDLNLNKINYIYSLNQLEDTEQLLFFQDEDSQYLLSRYLG